MTSADGAAETFERYRASLFGVAYRITGTVADAEDAVQEGWLRWSGVDRGAIRDARAFLVRTVTNLALDRLRRRRARREEYVGEWLPEPLAVAPDVAEQAELAETLSMGLLVVLESLSPLERAVFVLREAFGYSHAEIAETLGRSEAAVRQLAHRARTHVRDRAPRFETDRSTRASVTRAFLDATRSGDVASLMEILAPDVALVADSGGLAPAPPRPLLGARKVARFMVAIAARPIPALAAAVVELNGEPAVLVSSAGEPVAAFFPQVVDGRVTAIHVQANPEKLRRLASHVT